MRIGMIADVYKPHISGITNYISLNKQFLEKLGHDVFVFTFGEKDYTDNETNIIRSPGLPLMDTGYFIGMRYSTQAHRLLNTMDIAHVHHPFLSGSLALRYCRPRNIPIIFTNHTRYDLYTQAYLPNVPEVVGETALQAYLPTFCRFCSLTIAPSAGMRNVLLRLGVDSPIDVVPNGIDLHRFQIPIQPLERSILGFEPQNVVLVYVGRLSPEKNLSFLLQAFNGAIQAYNHIRLLLIGDGPEREALQELVNSYGMERYVRFTGLLGYEEVPRYLAMADAFVTASVTEVHPLSVIEAMAAGLPVLGIQSPGVGDTIEDGETGLLAAQEDLAIFTAKMVRMVIDVENRKRMGQKACQAASNYAIENTAQAVLDRYHQLVERSGKRKRGWHPHRSSEIPRS